MTERLRMVVGFLWSGPKVLLVQKNKPVWQRGLWNGVGGKLEGEETPIEAMVREFFEETTIKTTESHWTPYCVETGPEYVAHFFSAHINPVGPVPDVNDAGERLQWFVADEIPRRSVIGNVQWLLPMSRDWRNFSEPVEVNVEDDIRIMPWW